MRPLIKQQLAQLEPFLDALRVRVLLVMRLTMANPGAFDSPSVREIPELTRLLAAVGAEIPQVHEINCKLSAFALLAQHRINHSDPAEVDQVASQVTVELRALVSGIQDRLKHWRTFVPTCVLRTPARRPSPARRWVSV